MTGAIVLYAADAAERRRLEAGAREASPRSVLSIADALGALPDLIEGGAAELVLAAPAPAEWDQMDWAALSRRASLVLLLDDPARMVEALQAGAAAVLPLSAEAAEIGAALAAAARGLKLLPGDALGLLLPERPATSDDGEAGGVLTARERDVLTALADGASNKAIARRLGISFHTVKFHVASILAKLDAESRTEAVAQAARLGLVML
jgi:DNA-binding CsgD family transcriptional regulator